MHITFTQISMNVSWDWTLVMRMPPALMLLEVKGVSTAPVIQDTQAMAVLALVSSSLHCGLCKRLMKTVCHLRVYSCYSSTNFDPTSEHVVQCSLNMDVCDDNAACVKHSNGSQCVSNTGYTGDGQTCIDNDAVRGYVCIYNVS